MESGKLSKQMLASGPSRMMKKAPKPTALDPALRKYPSGSKVLQASWAQ